MSKNKSFRVFKIGREGIPPLKWFLWITVPIAGGMLTAVVEKLSGGSFTGWTAFLLSCSSVAIVVTILYTLMSTLNKKYNLIETFFQPQIIPEKSAKKDRIIPLWSPPEKKLSYADYFKDLFPFLVILIILFLVVPLSDPRSAEIKDKDPGRYYLPLYILFGILFFYLLMLLVMFFDLKRINQRLYDFSVQHGLVFIPRKDSWFVGMGVSGQVQGKYKRFQLGAIGYGFTLPYSNRGFVSRVKIEESSPPLLVSTKSSQLHSQYPAPLNLYLGKTSKKKIPTNDKIFDRRYTVYCRDQDVVHAVLKKNLRRELSENNLDLYVGQGYVTLVRERRIPSKQKLTRQIDLTVKIAEKYPATTK